MLTRFFEIFFCCCYSIDVATFPTVAEDHNLIIKCSLSLSKVNWPQMGSSLVKRTTVTFLNKSKIQKAESGYLNPAIVTACSDIIGN